MFTGIVAAVGRIETIKPAPGGVRLHIATGPLDMADVQLGDSIAVNGVCLTVVAFDKTFLRRRCHRLRWPSSPDFRRVPR